MLLSIERTDRRTNNRPFYDAYRILCGPRNNRALYARANSAEVYVGLYGVQIRCSKRQPMCSPEETVRANSASELTVGVVLTGVVLSGHREASSPGPGDLRRRQVPKWRIYETTAHQRISPMTIRLQFSEPAHTMKLLRGPRPVVTFLSR